MRLSVWLFRVVRQPFWRRSICEQLGRARALLVVYIADCSLSVGRIEGLDESPKGYGKNDEHSLIFKHFGSVLINVGSQVECEL